MILTRYASNVGVLITLHVVNARKWGRKWREFSSAADSWPAFSSVAATHHCMPREDASSLLSQEHFSSHD
jgi:hypothetical protein